MTSPHGFTPYTAAKIASALGGAKREGKGWRAKCPVPGHGKGRGDKRPSLSLRDVENKVLVHCPCGCPQDVVIDALKTQGLWRQEAPYLHKGAAQVAKSAQVTQLTQLTQGKTKQARTLWQRSLLPEGTPVETYLRCRGFTGPIPPTLRFLPDAKHPQNTPHPAMIAAVEVVPSRKVVAVHRTFLAPSGVGKAPVEPEKMSLGPIGGGAVRLAPAGERLVVAEGIETALSILDATDIPTWVALSTGSLGALILPPLVSDVVIAADNDGPGIDAANEAAHRWAMEGRKVRIALPPLGKDFNDLANLMEAVA